MDSETGTNERGSASDGKFSDFAWRMSSELIRVYLVFLRFGNYLLRLVQ
jgi:hypothetical protein